MNKEVLLKYLSNVVELSDAEKDFAFNTLVREISAHLNFDEAIKINDLGVFQLKKEPLPRQERKSLTPQALKEKRTLIYSPPFDKSPGETDALFLTIDVNELNLVATDDVDKIFSISVNKPLLPIVSGDLKDGFAAKIHDSEPTEKLEERIRNLISGGEILKDYDLWSEFLDIYSPQSLDTEFPKPGIEKIQEYEDTPEILLSKIDDESTETKKLSNDIAAFEEFTTSESELHENVYENHMDRLEETDLITQSKSADVSPGISKTTDISSVSKEEHVIEPELKQSISSSKTAKSIQRVTREYEPKKDLFAQLEAYLKEEEQKDQLTVNQEYHITSSDSVKPEFHPASEEKKPIKVARISSKSVQPFYQKSWFIVTVFIVVISLVAIIIFYKGDDAQKSSANNLEQSSIVPDQVIENKVPAGEQTKNIKEEKDPVQRTGMYRIIPNDVQVSNQIYFDGKMYTVQVSSWRSSTIAEKEVQRLKAQKFDAFIYQVFIESKNNTWNRVRIGYFTSQEDAEAFLVNNKF